MEDNNSKHKQSSFFLRLLDKYSKDIIINGIQIDYSKMSITFDNSILKPQITYVDGHQVISLFEKSTLPDLTNGNPLIQALKGEEGWTIDHNKILNLLSEFVQTTKLLAPFYDTMLCIRTQSTLNTHFLDLLTQFIEHDMLIKGAAVYDVVASSILLDARIDQSTPNFNFAELEESIIKMIDEHDDKFSFKYLPDKYMYSLQTFEQCNSPEIMTLQDSNYLNGKDVLVFDALQNTNELTKYCKKIIEIFVPKSVTILRLFPIEN